MFLAAGPQAQPPFRLSLTFGPPSLNLRLHKPTIPSASGRTFHYPSVVYDVWPFVARCSSRGWSTVPRLAHIITWKKPEKLPDGAVCVLRANLPFSVHRLVVREFPCLTFLACELSLSASLSLSLSLSLLQLRLRHCLGPIYCRSPSLDGGSNKNIIWIILNRNRATPAGGCQDARRIRPTNKGRTEHITWKGSFP